MCAHMSLGAHTSAHMSFGAHTSLGAHTSAQMSAHTTLGEQMSAYMSLGGHTSAHTNACMCAFLPQAHNSNNSLELTSGLHIYTF